MRKLITAGAVVLSAVVALSGCTVNTGAAGFEGSDGTGAVSTPSVDAPTDQVDIVTGAPAAGTNAAIAWEALMSPVGEYAASASYQAVIDKFGAVEPYVTINTAEERHISALTRQLEKAGVTVPTNPYLGRIVAPTDLETAAIAWAEGEVNNVELYDSLIVQSTDDRLTMVLNNLRSASLDSHLPLFEFAAENGGTLTQEQMHSR
jgi:hypothetical protein